MSAKTIDAIASAASHFDMAYRAPDALGDIADDSGRLGTIIKVLTAEKKRLDATFLEQGVDKATGALYELSKVNGGTRWCVDTVALKAAHGDAYGPFGKVSSVRASVRVKPVPRLTS